MADDLIPHGNRPTLQWPFLRSPSEPTRSSAAYPFRAHGGRQDCPRISPLVVVPPCRSILPKTPAGFRRVVFGSSPFEPNSPESLPALRHPPARAVHSLFTTEGSRRRSGAQSGLQNSSRLRSDLGLIPRISAPSPTCISGASTKKPSSTHHWLPERGSR